MIVRGLRQAAGITQEGWAARLGYGRRTIQRWEHGLQPPDAAQAVDLVALSGKLRLFRTFGKGPLDGLSLDADRLSAILAEARLAHGARRDARRVTDRRHIPHNLPEDLSSLVGREWEIDELARLVSVSRLVTLNGTGGVGKTRLALRVAHEVLTAFRDGAWLVELADVTDPALVPIAVAHAIAAQEIPGRAARDVVIQNLQAQRALLVVDNCEHVGEAVARLVADLLKTCPDVHVLATSRERLRVSGEVAWPLAPLITPQEADELALDVVAGSDAVRLFVERARAVRPSFELLPENAADVARICRRLDGLPLAIELAAACMSLVTPTELDARLADRLDPLSAPGPIVAARHQTVTATLDWSWSLLTGEERALLARLSVFVDGCELDAIAAVVGESGLFSRLGRLVDLSLVSARPDLAGRTTRYRLLETVRAYASHKLSETIGRADAERRVAAWCGQTARVAGRAIHGPDQARWYRWIEAEHGTIRSVMRRSLEGGDATIALELIASLWWAWGVLGRGTEAEDWTQRALAVTDGQPASDRRAATLLAAGVYASFRGSLDQARVRLQEAEDAGRALDDRQVALAVKGQRARLLQFSGGFEEAAQLAEEVLQLADEQEDGWTRARMLEMHAHAELRAGRLQAANAALDESLRLARRDGDIWGVATVLAELGDLARSAGRPDNAEMRYMESLALRRGLGIPGSTPSLLQNLGFATLASGDTERAAASFRDAFTQFRRTGDVRGMAECAIGLAGVAEGRKDASRAAELLGWAESSLRAAAMEIWPSNRSQRARTLAAVREALGERAWQAARARGEALSLEAIVAMTISMVSDA